MSVCLPYFYHKQIQIQELTESRIGDPKALNALPLREGTGKHIHEPLPRTTTAPEVSDIATDVYIPSFKARIPHQQHEIMAKHFPKSLPL
jgi:hypothetical protein